MRKWIENAKAAFRPRLIMAPQISFYYLSYLFLVSHFAPLHCMCACVRARKFFLRTFSSGGQCHVLNHRWWCISKSQPMSSLKHIMKTSGKLNEIILPIYLLPSSQSIQSASLSLSPSLELGISMKMAYLCGKSALVSFRLQISFELLHSKWVFHRLKRTSHMFGKSFKIFRPRRHSCIFLSNCSSQKFHLLRCNPIFIRTLQFVLQQFLSNHLLEEALVHAETHQISMWIHVSSVAMHISIWF